MVIVLLGYMGSGKSSVGKMLAERLKWPFIDLDAYIEAKTKLSIPELFEQHGEIYFRKVEAQALFDAINQENPSVIATGGGTPCYGRIMERLIEMHSVATVYLKADIELLTQRLFPEKGNRPLIAHLETQESLSDFIRKHLFERAFYYNKAAEVVSVRGKNEREISEEIVAHLF